MTGAVVRADDLVVQFPGGRAPALSGVSFGLDPGDGLVVVGGDGSGKSTLLRTVVGVVLPTYGTVSVFGASPGDPATRRRVGFAPESRPFPAGLRSRDVLDLVCLVHGCPSASSEALLARVGAPDIALRRVERLAIEDARRLSLACALAGDPDLLVLDDPWEFPETVTEIASARARGATVLVGTPDAGGFPALLGRCLTLDAGEVVG